MKIHHPGTWARASGYANAVEATGRHLLLAGQIGWNPETGQFETDDFAQQARRALSNIAALLKEAGANPSHLARLTWYITDRDEYMDAREEIGIAYREIFGKHYPAMSVVIVSGLIEERAKVEIEASAIIPN